MAEATLTHGAVPPSLNRIGTRGSHWAVTRAKRDWQSILERLLMASRDVPRLDLGHVTAHLRFVFADRRRRDAGNFSWLLEKALGDALVNGGWIKDDTPQFFIVESPVLMTYGLAVSTNVDLNWED